MREARVGGDLRFWLRFREFVRKNRENIMIARCTTKERAQERIGQERFLSRVASPRLSSASQFKLHADEPYVRPMHGFKVPRDSPLVA